MPPRPQPPPPAYKHFCRVCNKGFTCGSALGGHMRAHAVVDDGPGADDDDDEPVSCEDGGPSTTATTTHVYALRANPNRLTRGCQVCKNCGKEFSSMELFLEHGKCTSGEDDDADADGESPPSAADEEEDASVRAGGWSKGKRSRRAKSIAGGGDDAAPATSAAPSGEDEEEDLANCLVLLSSSKSDKAGVVAEADQEPCAPPAKHGRRPHLQPQQPSSMLVPAPDQAMVLPLALPAPQYVTPVPRGLFECKACKKVFTSHQALGGHRASHKKVKGCFAAKAESGAGEPPHHHAPPADPGEEKGNAAAAADAMHASGGADARTNVNATTGGDTTNAGTSEATPSLTMAITATDHEPPAGALAIAPFKKKAKMHECSVCHRLFSSGQALGGHKRCHWLTSGTGEHATITSLTAEGLVAAAGHQLTLRPLVDAPEPGLDLTIAANPLPVLASSRVAEVGTSSLHLDASPSLYLQPAAAPSNPSQPNKMAATSSHNGNDAVTPREAAEDEADSTTVKKAKLSDLKDVSAAGETTPWLQVGIGSTSAGGDGKSAPE